MTDSKTVVEDLAAWLSAVWDEEERLATDGLTPGPWTLEYDCPEGEHHHDWDEAWVSGWHGATVGTFNERYTSGPRDAAHVVRQQPSAVLARIAADRSILARYERVLQDRREHPADLALAGALLALKGAVMDLASAYRDRPDAPEWLVERQGVEQ